MYCCTGSFDARYVREKVFRFHLSERTDGTFLFELFIFSFVLVEELFCLLACSYSWFRCVYLMCVQGEEWAKFAKACGLQPGSPAKQSKPPRSTRNAALEPPKKVFPAKKRASPPKKTESIPTTNSSSTKKRVPFQPTTNIENNIEKVNTSPTKRRPKTDENAVPREGNKPLRNRTSPSKSSSKHLNTDGKKQTTSQKKNKNKDKENISNFTPADVKGLLQGKTLNFDLVSNDKSIDPINNNVIVARMAVFPAHAPLIEDTPAPSNTATNTQKPNAAEANPFAEKVDDAANTANTATTEGAKAFTKAELFTKVEQLEVKNKVSSFFFLFCKASRCSQTIPLRVVLSLSYFELTEFVCMYIVWLVIG